MCYLVFASDLLLTRQLDYVVLRLAGRADAPTGMRQLLIKVVGRVDQDMFGCHLSATGPTASSATLQSRFICFPVNCTIQAHPDQF